MKVKLLVPDVSVRVDSVLWYLSEWSPTERHSPSAEPLASLMVTGIVPHVGGPVLPPGGITTLRITLENRNSVPLVNASITDPLPGNTADGLIVASPTGSTAYALSAGGPILHPGIAGWVIVPIASHTLSNRPIVLPDTGEVRITVVAGRDASANFDMQSIASLLHGDQIRVRRSAHKVRFLHPRGWSYYATLRRKLRWYEGVV